MRNKVLRLILIGFVAGDVGCNLIALFISGFRSLCTDKLIGVMGSVAAALAVQTLLSLLIGAASVGGVALYDIDLPMAASFAIHYILIEATYVPSALFLGWLSPSLKQIGISAAVMLAVFTLIFVISHFIYKRKTKELNEINRKNNER